MRWSYLLVLGSSPARAPWSWRCRARRYAAEVNALMSLATLVAARCSCSGSFATGRCCSWHEQFFIDPFNVFLVALTAFVGFTTALFSRPYMRIEEHHGPDHPATAAALPQHVPALHGDDAARAADQQHGAPVGGDGGGDALHRAPGLALPHPGQPGGGLEVLHPLRRRHRPGALRHDSPLLRRRESSWARRG